MKWLNIAGSVIGLMFALFLFSKQVYNEAYSHGMMMSACSFISNEKGITEAANTVACDAAIKATKHP